MAKFRFKIKIKDRNCQAKIGTINTLHGKIQTPAFVPVGTAATIKSLTPQEISNCKIDVFFVNTYHMLFRPGIETVEKLGGLHKFMNWNGPIMTDSGGFQIFSLADTEAKQKSLTARNLVKIGEKGIFFKSAWDGKEKFLGPKESILAQQNLGADIMMALDECTFYPISKKRAKKAMQRTHVWAKLCLKQHLERNSNQALFGIVQGSVFEDLRKQSAKYIAQLPFNGFAIGSVANSREPREKVFQVLDWTLPILLPMAKPIHFLGIGEIEDILIGIEKGIDSFDCVTPTRLGRMGWIFHKQAGVKNKFRYDITKRYYSLDKSSLEKGCKCFTCKNFTIAYIHHLFRSRELLAYRLATIHNLYFFGNFMEQIRSSIAENRFKKIKSHWLNIK